MTPQLAGNLIALPWILMLLVWLVSAPSAKRRTQQWGRGKEALLRIAFGACVAIVVFLSPVRSADLAYQVSAAYGSIAAAGVILVFIGVAIAIWARAALGRNWSSHPSVQENHELVTSGPYRFVRHPIYTGIILALAGSALTGNLLWIIIFLSAVPIFLRRIPAEEKIMLGLFPDRYPDYMGRTKRLIPFVW